MKTKLTLLLIATTAFFATAQNNEACTENLSLMATNAQAKDPSAYTYLTELRKSCPSYDKRIYSYGEYAIKNMITGKEGAEKEVLVRDLMKLYDENFQYFPETGKGVSMKKGLALFNYTTGKQDEVFELFDNAFKNDKENFTSTRALYAYFEIYVKNYEANTKGIQLQQVFDMYDDVSEQLAVIQKSVSDAKDVLIAKEEAGQELDTKEVKAKTKYESELEDVATVTSSMDAVIFKLSSCDKLIPFYQKSFEANKTNKLWLQRAASRLEAKSCESDPLFTKISEALYKLDPSAEAAYNLGSVELQRKNTTKALEYFNKSASLFTDNSKKAAVYMKIASMYAKSNKSQARSYAKKALAAKPSYGSAYLLIAQLVGESVNECGNSPFEKRAIYWLAARYADKAGSADSSVRATANKMAASYRAAAPSKTDIFTANMAGKTITFNCWVGESITVPSL